MKVTLEKVGESIVLTFEGGVTVMLETIDAIQLGSALLKVGVLGADSLDIEKLEE